MSVQWQETDTMREELDDLQVCNFFFQSCEADPKRINFLCTDSVMILLH